jgi:phospholipid/cholesterol/gamma-HCH transport system substrate-binding protein
MPSPEQVNWAKLRSSAVILAGLLILGTLGYLLTGGTFLQAKTEIYIYLPDATGVSAGSPVRVDGIGVGKVSRVELSGSNQPNRVVKVTMTIARDRLISITDDSTAQTTSDTIVGDKFIDITSGTSAGHLMPGGELKYKSSGELMARLDLSQFQQQMPDRATAGRHRPGKSPLGAFIKGDAIYNDLRKVASCSAASTSRPTRLRRSAGRCIRTRCTASYRAVAAVGPGLARLQAGQGSGGVLPRHAAV